MLESSDLTSTYCVGRHVFGVPVAFSPSGVATGTFKFPDFPAVGPALDVTVHATGITRAGFLAEVAKRRGELKSSTADDVDVLSEDKELNHNSHLFRVQEIGDSFVSELILLRGTHLVTVRLDSYNNTFLNAEKNLLKFASEIFEVSPSGPRGFCLGGLDFVGAYSLERGAGLFRDGLGAQFDIEVDTYTVDESTPLLKRISGPGSLLKLILLDNGVLRSGEREVAGMRSQEWLGWAKLSEDNDNKSFKFMLETVRAKPGRDSPRINLTFKTSQALDDGTSSMTVLSDADAIRLWDATIKAIRRLP